MSEPKTAGEAVQRVAQDDNWIIDDTLSNDIGSAVIRWHKQTTKKPKIRLCVECLHYVSNKVIGGEHCNAERIDRVSGRKCNPVDARFARYCATDECGQHGLLWEAKQDADAEFPWRCPSCGARFKDPDALGDPGVCSDCDGKNRILVHD